MSIGGTTPKKIIKEGVIEALGLQPIDVVDGELTVAFDPSIPAGTSARAEVTLDTGSLHLKLIHLTTDPEVSAEVYVVLGGKEAKLVELGENMEMEIDVDEYYGDILTPELILVGITTADTTALRAVKLRYGGKVRGL
jgi:hypothetical protein